VECLQPTMIGVSSISGETGYYLQGAGRHVSCVQWTEFQGARIDNSQAMFCRVEE
jgi:hypothetical protein